MSAQDLIIYAAIILAAGFCLVIGHYLWTNISDAINNTVGIAETNIVSETIIKADTVFDMYDSLLVFLQLGLLVAVVVSFFYLDTHPVFFFTSLFILIMAVIIGAVFSNVWFELGAGTMGATITSSFPQSDWIMDNLPIFVLITGVVGFVVLYGKAGGGKT